QCVVAVAPGRRMRMLGRQSVLDADDGDTRPLGQVPAGGVGTGDAADDPAPTVVPDEHRQGRVDRWPVDARGDRTVGCRNGDVLHRRQVWTWAAGRVQRL